MSSRSGIQRRTCGSPRARLQAKPAPKALGQAWVAGAEPFRDHAVLEANDQEHFVPGPEKPARCRVEGHVGLDPAAAWIVQLNQKIARFAWIVLEGDRSAGAAEQLLYLRER